MSSYLADPAMSGVWLDQCQSANNNVSGGVSGSSSSRGGVGSPMLSTASYYHHQPHLQQPHGGVSSSGGVVRSLTTQYDPGFHVSDCRNPPHLQLQHFHPQQPAYQHQLLVQHHQQHHVQPGGGLLYWKQQQCMLMERQSQVASAGVCGAVGQLSACGMMAVSGSGSGPGTDCPSMSLRNAAEVEWSSGQAVPSTGVSSSGFTSANYITHEDHHHPRSSTATDGSTFLAAPDLNPATSTTFPTTVACSQPLSVEACSPAALSTQLSMGGHCERAASASELDDGVASAVSGGDLDRVDSVDSVSASGVTQCGSTVCCYDQQNGSSSTNNRDSCPKDNSVCCTTDNLETSSVLSDLTLHTEWSSTAPLNNSSSSSSGSSSCDSGVDSPPRQLGTSSTEVDCTSRQMVSASTQVAASSPVGHSVVAPLRWNRVTSNGVVVYISPSGVTMTSVDEARQYLLSPSTCKCGLECPINVHQVFNFDPKVITRPWSRCSPDPPNSAASKMCNHRRKADSCRTPTNATRKDVLPTFQEQRCNPHNNPFFREQMMQAMVMGGSSNVRHQVTHHRPMLSNHHHHLQHHHHHQHQETSPRDRSGDSNNDEISHHHHHHHHHPSDEQHRDKLHEVAKPPEKDEQNHHEQQHYIQQQQQQYGDLSEDCQLRLSSELEQLETCSSRHNSLSADQSLFHHSVSEPMFTESSDHFVFDHGSSAGDNQHSLAHDRSGAVLFSSGNAPTSPSVPPTPRTPTTPPAVVGGSGRSEWSEGHTMVHAGSQTMSSVTVSSSSSSLSPASGSHPISPVLPSSVEESAQNSGCVSVTSVSAETAIKSESALSVSSTGHHEVPNVQGTSPRVVLSPVPTGLVPAGLVPVSSVPVSSVPAGPLPSVIASSSSVEGQAMPSFLDDPSGYLLKQTHLLNSSLSHERLSPAPTGTVTATETECSCPQCDNSPPLPPPSRQQHKATDRDESRITIAKANNTSGHTNTTTCTQVSIKTEPAEGAGCGLNRVGVSAASSVVTTAVSVGGTAAATATTSTQLTTLKQRSNNSSSSSARFAVSGNQRVSAATARTGTQIGRRVQHQQLGRKSQQQQQQRRVQVDRSIAAARVTGATTKHLGSNPAQVRTDTKLKSEAVSPRMTAVSLTLASTTASIATTTTTAITTKAAAVKLVAPKATPTVIQSPTASLIGATARQSKQSCLTATGGSLRRTAPPTLAPAPPQQLQAPLAAPSAQFQVFGTGTELPLLLPNGQLLLATPTIQPFVQYAPPPPAPPLPQHQQQQWLLSAGGTLFQAHTPAPTPAIDPPPSGGKRKRRRIQSSANAATVTTSTVSSSVHSSQLQQQVSAPASLMPTLVLSSPATAATAAPSANQAGLNLLQPLFWPTAAAATGGQLLIQTVGGQLISAPTAAAAQSAPGGQLLQLVQSAPTLTFAPAPAPAPQLPSPCTAPADSSTTPAPQSSPAAHRVQECSSAAPAPGCEMVTSTVRTPDALESGDCVASVATTVTDVSSQRGVGQQGGKRLRPSTNVNAPLDVGDLVWGCNQGADSWPGRIINRSDVPATPSDHVWVCWFGDHTMSLLPKAKLRRFQSPGLPAKPKKHSVLNTSFEEAVQEAMTASQN